MTPGGEKLIRFENVTKEFSSKNNKTLAVNNVNLEIEKGDIFGIIGFSGAGKSTLVRLINLLEYPSKGDIYFDDVERLCKNVFKSMKTSNPPIGSNVSPSKLLITRYFGFNAPDKMPEEYGFILHILHYNVS